MRNVEAKRNPGPWNWRWHFVRLVTGGVIEAVPTLPKRPVHGHETLVIKLGEPGELNIAEVKMPENDTKELLPIEDFRRNLVPGTFIALDLKDWGQRFVGTFKEWAEDERRLEVLIAEDPSGRGWIIQPDAVVQAFWAPAGYRP